MSGEDTREALVARLRKAATCIYIAVEKPVADDVSAMLREAADHLAAPDRSQPVAGTTADRSGPIALSEAQQRTVKEWAADDRLWTTQDTVEINLRTFARKILALAAPVGEKMFPVVSGGRIPWRVAEVAYIEYARRYGKSQSLERIGERGGFHVDELDMLLPNWRTLVAAPVGEQEMPPIEVGDWVLVDNRDFGDILIARRAGELPSHREWYYKAEDICEIRKADGRVWRRNG